MEDGEDLKAPKRWNVYLGVFIIVALVIAGMVYLLYKPEEPSEIIPGPEYDSFYLNHTDTNYRNVHQFEVMGETPEKYELSDVIIVVVGEVNGTRIIITNDTRLSEAKNNTFHRYPYRDISYFDLDSDNLLTEGDFITITIDPSDPGIYTIKLIHHKGKSLTVIEFEVE